MKTTAQHSKQNNSTFILVLPELTGDSVLSITFAEKTPPPQTGDKWNLLYLCLAAMIFSGLMVVWLAIKRDKIR